MKLNRYLFIGALSALLFAFTGCGEDRTEYVDETGATPGAFSFTSQTGVTVGATVTSNSITVSGITAAAPISVTGGSYSIGTGDFTTTAGTVTNGQTVRVQHTASASAGTTTTTTLTIGGVSAKFTSTTAGSAPALDGKALYAAKCISCHSSPKALSTTTVAAIKAKSMEMGLSDAELQAIVDYLAAL